jgi:hypothetical protein
MDIDYQKSVADSVLKKLRQYDSMAILAGGAPRDWYLGNLARDLDFYFTMSSKWFGDVQSSMDALGLPSDGNEGDSQLYDKNPDILGVFSGDFMDMPIQLICIKNTPTDAVRKFALDICQAWYFDGHIFTTYNFKVATEKKIIRITNNLYADQDAYIQRIINKFPDFLFVGHTTSGF